jgi:hypothetical protein
MPGSSTHIFIAVLIFIGCLYFSGWWWAVMYAPVVIVYSLLPDMDAPISPIAKFVRQFALFGFLLGGLAYWFLKRFYVGVFAAFCLLLLIAQAVSTHRGHVHTIPLGLVLAVPLLYLGWGWFIAGVFGYMTHLLLDGCLRLRHKSVASAAKIV